uniref:MLP-like protein 43 n=1 Tax=Erigeron canadensis TaxID=72917 RepID=UPI001CB8F477|nr:MLP-like protein 43 [Erigeron canadensis]
MAVSGKMMMYVNIKSRGDELHEIIRFRPNDLALMLPDKVHSCVLLDGEWGAVGSIISWNFTYDEKVEVFKQQIEEVDEANHKIVFKILEARLLEKIYKSFKITFHVEEQAEGRDRKLGAVTFEFEKENSKFPYPTAFMDFLCDVFSLLDDYNTNK